MKLAADVNTTVENEFVKKGGVAAAQWVLGRFARVPGAQLEKEELGQLGALNSHVDSTTEWGLRATYRLTAMKAFFKNRSWTSVCIRCAEEVSTLTVPFPSHRSGYV